MVMIGSGLKVSVQEDDNGKIIHDETLNKMAVISDLKYKIIRYSEYSPIAAFSPPITLYSHFTIDPSLA